MENTVKTENENGKNNCRQSYSDIYKYIDKSKLELANEDFESQSSNEDFINEFLKAQQNAN